MEFMQYHIPYSGKLLREKTFVNFEVLCLYAKVFFTKFGAWCPLVLQNKQSAKIVFSPIRESFLLYGTVLCGCIDVHTICTNLAAFFWENSICASASPMLMPRIWEKGETILSQTQDQTVFHINVTHQFCNKVQLHWTCFDLTHTAIKLLRRKDNVRCAGQATW